MFVSAYQTDITVRESRGIALKRAYTVKGGTAMLSLEQPMIPPEVWRASWGIFVPQTEDIYKRKRRIPLLRISTSINLLSNINLLYLSSSFIWPTFLTLILCYPVLLHFGISSCLSCINLSDTFSPSAHMLCLSCAQSISPFIPFLAALSLSHADIRTIRVSWCCSHRLHERPFVTARSFLLLSLSFFSHNTHYLPDLISSVWLSLELMSVTAHFSKGTVHPSSCLTRGFILSVLTHLNVKLRQRPQQG